MRFIIDTAFVVEPSAGQRGNVVVQDSLRDVVVKTNIAWVIVEVESMDRHASVPSNYTFET